MADEDNQRAEILQKQLDFECKNLGKSLDVLQESIDLLRVRVKYQTFDLEATKREKKMLENIIEDMLEREADEFN